MRSRMGGPRKNRYEHLSPDALNVALRLLKLLGVEHFTIFPHLLGDPYKKADEQMARFVEDVLPLL